MSASPEDWTPVAGIYMSHHGTPRALLLYLEKPPTVGRNNQQLHLIKRTQVPDAIRRIVEIHEAQGPPQGAQGPQAAQGPQGDGPTSTTWL